jgi:hypothetical protein
MPFEGLPEGGGAARAGQSATHTATICLTRTGDQIEPA